MVHRSRHNNRLFYWQPLGRKISGRDAAAGYASVVYCEGDVKLEGELMGFKRFWLAIILIILNTITPYKVYSATITQQNIYIDWVSVKSYSASGVDTTTTLASELGCSSVSDVPLTSASSFIVNQDIAIPGAGTGGAELIANITAINANTVTISPATSCTTPVVIGTTVYHDDTQAIKDAIATGKNVYIPEGNYNVTNWGDDSTAIILSNHGQTIEGANNTYNSPYYGAVLLVRSTATNMMRVTGNSVAIRRVGFQRSGNSDSTAGAVISISNGTDACATAANRIAYPTLEDIFIQGPYGNSPRFYDGIRVEESNRGYYHNIKMSNILGRGVVIDTESPCGDNYFNNVAVYGDGSANTSIGMLITDADYNRYDNLKFVSLGQCLKLDPTNTNMYAQQFTEIGCENSIGTSSTEAAIQIGDTGTYTTLYTILDSVEVNGGTTGYSQPGIKINTYALRTIVTNSQVREMYGNGIEIRGDYATVSNNVAYNNGDAASEYGIANYSVANGNSIVGNIVYGSGTLAGGPDNAEIFCQGATPNPIVSIVGNYVEDGEITNNCTAYTAGNTEYDPRFKKSNIDMESDGDVGILTNLSIGTITPGAADGDVGVLSMSTGTAPTTSPADVVQLWASDVGGVAGDHGLYIKGELAVTHVIGQYMGLATTTPSSTLQIGEALDSSSTYIQIDTLLNDLGGPPEAADCSTSLEVGRLIISTRYTATSEFRLWVCTKTSSSTYAWKYTVLN